MILSYRDKRTERFARGERVKPFEPFRKQAENRFVRLEAASSSRSGGTCGNRRKAEGVIARASGVSASTINGVFVSEWPDGAAGPSNVEIVDYH